MTIVLFEDEQVTRLYPVTIGKPAFAISCGTHHLADLLLELGSDVRALVRPHLRAVLPAQTPLWDGSGGASEHLLFVNARLVPTVDALEQLRSVLAAGRPGLAMTPQVHSAGAGNHRTESARGNGSLAVALVARGAPTTGVHALVDHLKSLALDPLPVRLPLFEYPHDIIRYHPAALAASLERRLKLGHYEETADGVFVAAGAQLGQYTVCDTHGGPIVLEERASVGPHSYLKGPLHVGAGARVIEHTSLKDGVALGHTTKVGGEVECSVIEPYTNKQHHGFLGHSYLGSWVNLGAGTCNSDLKNTYGSVNMEYQGQKVATGMQFLGCIIGDYAKTAINTGIFTGKIVGACSMVYGFVTTNVPSFVNYARSFGQVTEAPPDVMVATQARMFARRNVAQRECDIRLLHDMYDLTRHERQLAGEPLAL